MSFFDLDFCRNNCGRQISHAADYCAVYPNCKPRYADHREAPAPVAPEKVVRLKRGLWLELRDQLATGRMLRKRWRGRTSENVTFGAIGYGFR